MNTGQNSFVISKGVRCLNLLEVYQLSIFYTEAEILCLANSHKIINCLGRLYEDL